MVAEGEQTQINVTGKNIALIILIRLTYEVWRNKLDMQKVVWWVPNEKQGIIVLLGSITDNKKGEKVVSTLTAHNLYSKNGLKQL